MNPSTVITIGLVLVVGASLLIVIAFFVERRTAKRAAELAAKLDPCVPRKGRT